MSEEDAGVLQGRPSGNFRRAPRDTMRGAEKKRSPSGPRLAGLGVRNAPLDAAVEGREVLNRRTESLGFVCCSQTLLQHSKQVLLTMLQRSGHADGVQTVFAGFV